MPAGKGSPKRQPAEETAARIPKDLLARLENQPEDVQRAVFRGLDELERNQTNEHVERNDETTQVIAAAENTDAKLALASLALGRLRMEYERQSQSDRLKSEERVNLYRFVFWASILLTPVFLSLFGYLVYREK